MNLKYYLRGLGIGIVITAIILGIAGRDKQAALSDEDIIIKGKNLGMIQDSELTDYVEAAKDNMEQDIREEIEAEYRELNRQQEADGQNAESSGQEAVKEPVLFTVKKGEEPISISERLEADGLVAAAAEFDKYLVDNGYDRKIVAREYTIPPGADMDTIAKIITGQKITEVTAEP